MTGIPPVPDRTCVRCGQTLPGIGLCECALPDNSAWNAAEAVTHYTPEEHDQPDCDADVDADPGTVMWGTLNPRKVTCPDCLRRLQSAVCGCDHPHLPGCTHCYACGLPVPANVPPALIPTPPGSAGGTQTQEASDG